MVRNPYLVQIQKPFLGCLIAFLPFLIRETTFKRLHLTAKDLIWFIVSISYLLSSYTKAIEPHWQQGTALTDLVGFNIYSRLYVMLLHQPKALEFINYSTIIIEVLIGIFGYFRRLRPLCWVLAFNFHLSILIVMNLTTVAIGNLIFFLFLFERDWLNLHFVARLRKTERTS